MAASLWSMSYVRVEVMNFNLNRKKTTQTSLIHENKLVSVVLKFCL